MLRVTSHFLLAFALALLAALAARPALARAPEQAAVAWTALGQGRVVSWDVRGELRVLRSVEVEPGVELAPGEVLLVPIDAGDVLQSSGEVLLGLASGSGDMPDTITWWPATPLGGVAEARQLRVPTWSSARFLAVRSALALTQRVQLSVARAVSDPLSWHRFDAAVASWLFDGVPLTQLPPPQAAPALRQVEALERALGRVAQPLRAPWLMARWLELSLRLRPLTSPYFARVAAAPTGATSSAAKADANAGLEYRDLQAGEELIFSDMRADVLRLELRATTTPTRVAIFEGEALSRVIEMDGRAKPLLQRTQSVRAVVPVGTPRVRLRLLEGSSSVGFAAFVQRGGVLDALTLRQSRTDNGERVRALASAARAPWLGWLSDAMSLGSQRSCERLASVATADLPLRALLAYESARCAATPEAVLSSLAGVRAGLAALPAASQATLERGVLQRLVDVGASRPDIGPARNLGGDPQDRQACDTLLATLALAPEARVLERAERAAASSPERADLVQLARRAWLRGSVWSALPASKPAVTRLRAAVPAAEPGSADLCSVHSAGGLRWTLLDARDGELVVGSSGGSHSHVLLRLEPGNTREVALKLGGVPLTVHAAAGLMGHVALAPGAHRVEVAAGDAVLARAPREGLVPCAELRELERWSLASSGAAFELTPADVDQPARFTVMEQSLGGRARELSVVAGGQRYVAWVRPPASGSIELPRAAGTRLQAQSTAPLEIRASLRQPRVPPPPARVVARRPEQASASEEQLLQRLREATRSLDAAGEARERAAAHLKRAELLTALGAARLADMERLRAGHAEPRAEPAAANAGHGLSFPQDTAPAVVLGLASRIPPLGAARDTAALAQARRLHEQDEPPAAIVQALSRAATSSSGADALLLASAAERAGLHGLAAEAYERIAHAAPSAGALARAATLFADTAASRSDSALAFRAYRLALRASEQGEAAVDALGRLGPTVSWLSASSAGSGTGSLLLAHSGPSANESLGTRIRRALLDAHSDAVLLREGRRLELHSDQPLPTELELSLSCLALEPSGACQAVLEVDGRKVPCAGLDAASSSFRTRCAVTLPPGTHRVDLSLTEAAGAAMAVHVTHRERTVQPRVVSSWTELDAAHPLELRVFGPTVLRITSRVEADRTQRLALELGDESGSERRVWDIPASSDPAVQRPGASALGPAELGAENELLWVVDKAGEQQLRLKPEQGRTLVRLSAAYGSGVPRARELHVAPSASPLPAALQASEAAAPQRAPFGFDAVEGPLTLNATISVQRQDMTESEGERGHLHQELRVSALRELWRSRAYGSASVIYRPRQGANSRGALGTLSSSARGAVPGFFARGLVMQQELSAGVATGWYGLAGLLWDLPLASGAELSPWASVIGRHAAAITEPTPDLDADVSSRYSRLQTLSLESGLRFDTRPFVDTLATYGVNARYGPYYSAIDRADVSVSLDMLPGGGLFPWITTWGSVSHRPTSSIRETPFTRTSLGAQVSFWSWSGGSEHWRLFGRVLQFVNWPTRDQTLSFALGASVDATFRRGLRDYAPRSVPFRARQEEGSARVQRQSPAREPAWELER